MDEYLHKWNLPMTNNAIAIAGFPKEVEKWVWEPVRDKFSVEWDD